MVNKVLSSKVTKVIGASYVTAAGHTVVSNLGCTPAQVGDTITYAAMRSLQTKRFGGKATQWVASTDTGHVFYKQVQ
jgi:hypothetical protein